MSWGVLEGGRGQLGRSWMTGLEVARGHLGGEQRRCERAGSSGDVKDLVPAGRGRRGDEEVVENGAKMPGEVEGKTESVGKWGDEIGE